VVKAKKVELIFEKLYLGLGNRLDPIWKSYLANNAKQL